MARRLLPDTLFGRLFVATVGVIGAMLLVFILLIVRERRELALLDSGAGSSANTIAETSQYLAGLSREQRDDARIKLREQRLTPDDVRPPAPRIQDEQQAALERAFAAHLQRHLGSEYKVSTGPPRARRSEIIPLHVLRRDLPPPDGPPPHGRMVRRDRIFDVTVTFPDGDKAIFRTFAPRSGPRLPRQIFLELGLLALALGIVLYAMTRTITRPLGDLARAADAMGRGATGTPLEETGAREIRHATRAFNSMQERLRRYLDSRTQVLAAMSHDLRTPLTRLRLRVESIEDDQLRQRLVEDLDEMSSMIRGALGVFRGLNDEETATCGAGRRSAHRRLGPRSLRRQTARIETLPRQPGSECDPSRCQSHDPDRRRPAIDRARPGRRPRHSRGHAGESVRAVLSSRTFP
jgi:HAMP domain-containing protein